MLGDLFNQDDADESVVLGSSGSGFVKVGLMVLLILHV